MAEININEIIVEDRVRQNIGFLDSLERSIQQVGILQPIGITTDKHLIFGGRRLQASKNIGLKTIPARVFDIAANDPITALRMEREENEHRVDLTPSEKVEVAKRIEVITGNRQGQRTDLQLPPTLEEVKSPKERESATVAAKSVDMKPETYRKAKAVVESGDNELVRQMDTGEKSIHAAYKSISKPDVTPTHIAGTTPTPKPTTELFEPKTFKITLCNNPEGDAKELLAKGGKDYCTKLAIAILKAAGHSIVDED